MSAVEAYRVTGDWRHLIDDGLADLDDLPDTVLPSGRVEFRVLTPQVARVDGTAYTFAPVTANVHRGRMELWLVGRVGDETIRWAADTRLWFQDREIPMPSVEFDLQSDLQFTELMEDAA